jgi:hypothetical protein
LIDPADQPGNFSGTPISYSRRARGGAPAIFVNNVMLLRNEPRPFGLNHRTLDSSFTLKHASISLQIRGLTAGASGMCDYSLENVASRAARVGDKLVSTQFVNALTRGFAAIGEPNIAVCLLPGTELGFDQDVECDHPLGLYERRKLREKVARFRQINLHSPYEHHDALEFPSGKVVLLTRLCVGQTGTVLQLPTHTQALTVARASAVGLPAPVD